MKLTYPALIIAALGLSSVFVSPSPAQAQEPLEYAYPDISVWTTERDVQDVLKNPLTMSWARVSAFSVSSAERVDLKNIAAYTQKVWGSEQRRTYLKGLDLAFHYLAEDSLAGSACDYVADSLMKHRLESHTISYENVCCAVLIIRAPHKSSP